MAVAGLPRLSRPPSLARSSMHSNITCKLATGPEAADSPALVYGAAHRLDTT